MSRPILASRQPRDDLTILGRERNGPFVGDENHPRDRRSRRLGPQGQHPGTSRKPRALQGIRYGNLRMRARHGGRGTRLQPRRNKAGNVDLGKTEGTDIPVVRSKAERTVRWYVGRLKLGIAWLSKCGARKVEGP